MRRFNSIKKSRKKSKDIDEKIEYLNKECYKTGLNETMTTRNIYVGTEKIPNTTYTDVESISIGGYGIGLSGADGNSLGGASIGSPSHSNQTGVALSPPHPVTGARRSAYHVRDGLGGTTPLRPGVTITRGFSNNPPPYTMGGALWFFDPTYNNGEGYWYNLEWGNFPNKTGWGFWDTIETGQLAGITFFNTDISQHSSGGGSLGTEINDKISNITFSSNGVVGPPTTNIFIKNDLGDPGFIPIDIGLSKQGYDYLLDKSGYSEPSESEPSESEREPIGFTPTTGTLTKWMSRKDFMKMFPDSTMSDYLDALPYGATDFMTPNPNYNNAWDLNTKGYEDFFMKGDLSALGNSDGKPKPRHERTPESDPDIDQQKTELLNKQQSELDNLKGKNVATKIDGALTFLKNAIGATNPIAKFITSIPVGDYGGEILTSMVLNEPIYQGDNDVPLKDKMSYVKNIPPTFFIDQSYSSSNIPSSSTEQPYSDANFYKDPTTGKIKAHTAETRKLYPDNTTTFSGKNALDLFGVTNPIAVRGNMHTQIVEPEGGEPYIKVHDFAYLNKEKINDRGELQTGVQSKIAQFISPLMDKFHGRKGGSQNHGGMSGYPPNINGVSEMEFKVPYSQWTDKQKEAYNKSRQKNESYISESVKLAHFEPEVLNVDIEQLRKGILPEFPKDPPPEMINGYSAKSKLAPKTIEGEPFIKITKKDLAKNHRLKDSEIDDFMKQINAINEFIKQNPDELKYVMIRYPKDDPRLAQLNWEMDQKMRASEEYMDTHFPENETLFKKLQNKIRDNIEKTDPRRIDTSVPIVSQEEALLAKKRRLSVLERFKKQVNVKPFFDRKTPEIDWKIDYLNRELEKTGFNEMMTTTDMYTVVDTVPTTPAEFGEVPDPDPVNGITSNNWQQPLGVDPNGNPASAPPTSFPRIWDNPGYLDPTEGLLNKDNVKGDGTDTPIYNTDDLTWQDPSEIPSGAVGGVQIEVGGMDPGIVGGYLDANGWHTTTGTNIRLGPPNFKTHPDLFKPVFYWVPFSIYNPFIDSYFPGSGNTPEYSGIVHTNPPRALFTAYMYVGGGRNKYETKPNHHGYTIPLSRNDLGDHNFLPIDVGKYGFSPEAYEYLKNAAGLDIASGEPDLDTYDWYLKTYPNSGAAQWYYNNPNSHPKNNPFLSPSDYVPFTDTAYNPNDSGYSDVVSDVDVNIGLGAQPGDQLAFFGGGNNNNKPPSPPTSRTNKGTLDATKASTGMYPNMTPEIFFQKYGITPNQYLNLP